MGFNAQLIECPLLSPLTCNPRIDLFSWRAQAKFGSLHACEVLFLGYQGFADDYPLDVESSVNTSA